MVVTFVCLLFCLLGGDSHALYLCLLCFFQAVGKVIPALNGKLT